MNFATGESGKVQVRNLVQVVGIVAPLCPTGKFVLSSPRGKWAQKTCAGRPKQRYSTGEPGKVQGLYKGPVGTGPAGSVFEENSFYRKTGVKDEGGRHVAKCRSDTRVAYP